MKKSLSALTLSVIMVCSLCACGRNTGNSNNTTSNSEITVVSREDGSGTRDAFVDIMKITDDKGNDITYDAAEITNSNSVMLSTVSGNKNAIGYVSVGTHSDNVKTVSVDGVKADAENVKSGKYKISRPFNICYKEGVLGELAKDFEKFVMSAEGQKTVKESGYTPIDTDVAYTASNLKGKISLAGSTSVAPIMEVLADKYKELNPDVTVEIQQSGSSAGISSAIEGVCDFAMASRDLKESEKKELVQKKFATDGIAVIVNKENKTDNLTAEQIKAIFTGKTTNWSEIEKVAK